MDPQVSSLYTALTAHKARSLIFLSYTRIFSANSLAVAADSLVVEEAEVARTVPAKQRTSCIA